MSTRFNVIKIASRIVFAVLAVLLLSASGVAWAQSSSLTMEQEKAVERVVRDYLRRNPEVIIEAIEALREKQQGSIEERVLKVIAARETELLKDPDTPIGGNPDGDITLVEFFDYRCGFCKRVFPTVLKLLKEDGNIRMALKEIPILGPESVYAAQAALASRNQGKYFKFHTALMKAKGGLTEKKVFLIATSVGLDVEALARNMEKQKPEIERMIKRNLRLADELEITGTPAFVIGDTVIRGAVDFDTLKQVVAEARAKEK